MQLTHPIKLGVNIDHVATLRQARRAPYPDPLLAALVAEQSGADSITLHLREDRRHIQDHDVHRFRSTLQTRMNLEMAATDEMIAIARQVRPQDVCLVPEKRAEVTTEGGLDVAGQKARLKECCAALRECGIRVSMFIDPDPEQIEASREIGAPVVELHTGAYAEATGEHQAKELMRLVHGSRHGVAGRPDGARRPRPALSQRAAGRGDRGDRRAEHRPRDHRARRVRRPGPGGARNAASHGRGPPRPADERTLSTRP